MVKVAINNLNDATLLTAGVVCHDLRFSNCDFSPLDDPFGGDSAVDWTARNTSQPFHWQTSL